MRTTWVGYRLVVGAVALGVLAVGQVGCELLRGAALLMGPEGQTRKVPAEYPHLAGKKVCIVVWADPYTLFEYSWVQLDVSEFVRAALEGTVRGATFVPNRQVLDYQRRNPDWDRDSPVRIGQHFGADRVLLIELTEYTTREPDSPHLKRGHISANLRVYDTAFPEAEPAFKAAIETAYPADSVGAYGVDDRSIRRQTMQAFGSQVAGKFYERQEKVK